jgi:hypothetical protein
MSYFRRLTSSDANSPCSSMGCTVRKVPRGNGDSVASELQNHVQEDRAMKHRAPGNLKNKNSKTTILEARIHKH